MEFRVFVPPAAGDGAGTVPGAGGDTAAPAAATPPVPALIFLSGLTCTPANASEKAATALAAAAGAGLALVFPDTSPRGLGVAGEEEAWDLGTGAGFYLDATQAPWVSSEGGGEPTGYRMFTYVTRDLIGALNALGGCLDTTRLGVTGHSMGGHGALVAGLKRPDLFASVSALSPIAHPSACPWGVKAFGAYLGGNAGGGEGSTPSAWADWDATALVAAYAGPPRAFLIDVGTADEFLAAGQLRCADFAAAAATEAAGGVGGGSGGGVVSVELREQPGYDHSYFFIASFIADHVAHHAKVLVSGGK